MHGLGSTLAKFFSKKSARANRKTGLYISRCPKNEGAGGILCLKQQRTSNSCKKNKDKKIIIFKT
jgi:hypothetical protein